jgi:hypothetical protein
MVKNMDLELIVQQMEDLMKEILTAMYFRKKENINGLMVGHIKVYGIMEKCMDMAFINGPMAIDIKDNIKMEKNQDQENFTGMTAESTTDSGETV